MSCLDTIFFFLYICSPFFFLHFDYRQLAHKHVALCLSMNLQVIALCYLRLWLYFYALVVMSFYQPQTCTVTILFLSSHLYASRNLGLHVHLHMVKCHSSPAMFLLNWKFVTKLHLLPPPSRISYSTLLCNSSTKPGRSIATGATCGIPGKIMGIRQFWCGVWLQYPSIRGCFKITANQAS